MTALSTNSVIAVIGAGTMGAGVAQVAAAAGHRTLLYDTNLEAIDRALENIDKGLQRQIERGRMDEAKRQQILQNLVPTDELKALADSALVIEAIIEDLSIKQTLFAELEIICGDQAILASNTSSLSITAIARNLKQPERLVGMHFFNPAPVMKLVEVISGITTNAQIAETVFDTATAWGKKAVHAKSTPGFIVNRVARPFYAEALRALEEGLTDIATYDAIMREAGGFRMGPFELMDLIGHDVNYAVTCSVFEAFYQDPRFLPSLTQKELVDGGLLGRKTGRGFYDYREGASKPQPQSTHSGNRIRQIEIAGDLGIAEALIPLWESAGIKVQRGDGEGNHIQLDGTLIALSDGRSATQRAADSGHQDLVLFDLALDFSSCQRIALAAAETTRPEALMDAVALFQATGKAVSVCNDIPGLALTRTIAMLANEAAEAVMLQVCSTEAADTAMKSGVNYPKGPLEWAEQLGAKQVLTVLQNLQFAYGSDRYRPSQWLRQRVAAGRSLTNNS